MKRLFSILLCLSLFSAYQATSQTLLPMKPGNTKSVVVTSISNQYTYPTSLSANGTKVSGMPFGGMVSYYWTESSGLVTVSGELYGVANDGTGGGSWYNTSIQYNGSDVMTAGLWDPSTNQWTFLGMNPAVPTIFATDYNVGWDITSDGNTVVGMQWYPGYDYSAYKWTQSGGYTNIGSGVGQGSRASGISSNGLVVFGWAEFPSASRTPVIWYNNQTILIDNGQFGEAFGASTTGNYVTGTIGAMGFRWSPQGTVQFSNTLNTSGMTPTTVLNDGTVLGYTNGFPPLPNNRRAFVRDSLGTLMTFNDYAQARGMVDAQLWTFYSINDASEDGNKFIGAGIDPQGQTMTFLIEFIPEFPVLATFPTSLEFGTVLPGTQSPPQEVAITNTGNGSLVINSVGVSGPNASQFVLQNPGTFPQTLLSGDTLSIAVIFTPTSPGSKSATVSIVSNAGNRTVPLHGNGDYYTGTTSPSTDHIIFFPNPCFDQLSITGLSGGERIELKNLLGKTLLSVRNEKQPSIVMKVSGLDPGLYLLRIEQSNGARWVRKVTVREE